MTNSSFLRHSPQCQIPDLIPSHEPLIGQLSYHHLIIWAGTICAALAIIISTAHIFYHAFCCYRVGEQKYLMRVITVIPAFAIIHTIGVWWYPTLQYIQNIPEIVEAVALVSLFQLFVQQASGSTHRYDQDYWFSQLERHKRKKLIHMFKNDAEVKVPHNNGSLRWYRAICCCVYQFPVVKTLWTPIIIILTAVFCPTGLSGRGVKLLNGAVNIITTTVAVFALIIFYSRLRPTLKPNHAFRKAFVLKKMIGIVLLQATILSFVEGLGGIHPTATMSFGDYTVGIPGFMSQIEFFLFAIGFLFCYNVKEYKDIHRSDQEVAMGQGAGIQRQPTVGPTGKVGFFHAILAAMNISDLFIAIGRSFKHLFELRRKVYTVDGGRGTPLKTFHSNGSDEDNVNTPLQAHPAPPAHVAPMTDPRMYHQQHQQPYADHPAATAYDGYAAHAVPMQASGSQQGFHAPQAQHQYGNGHTAYYPQSHTQYGIEQEPDNRF